MESEGSEASWWLFASMKQFTHLFLVCYTNLISKSETRQVLWRDSLHKLQKREQEKSEISLLLEGTIYHTYTHKGWGETLKLFVFHQITVGS